MSTPAPLLGTSLHHTAVGAADFERVVAYYIDVLGFRSKWRWGAAPTRMAMLELATGDHIEVFEKLDALTTARPIIDHYGLETRDCRADTETLRQAGTKILSEPETFTVDTDAGPIPVAIAWFEGPAGERLELLEFHPN